MFEDLLYRANKFFYRIISVFLEKKGGSGGKSVRLSFTMALFLGGIFLCVLAGCFVDYGSGEDDYSGNFCLRNVYAGNCIA
jgi:hypothetical protein